MCQTLLVPAANQKDSNQFLHWLVTLPWMQEKILNTKGISDNKILSHSYSGTIQKEEGEYQILLLASHKLEKPYLSHWRSKSTFHPFPCLTTHIFLLLEN